MARDRSGSEYSESMSEATSCSCTTTSSVDKARSVSVSCSPLSRGCCGMFQEPFFLHPPGSRPRDGIYVNPMSAYIGEPAKPKDTAESFYLHSPQDLVYTRITRLFADTVDQRHAEKRDDGLTTVKVDVHVNNNGLFVDRPSNGTELPREPSEHAYEQICLRQDSESTGGTAVVHRKATDGAPDRTSDRSSRARKTERRCSRSSSASDCSNVSSEIPCFSSSVSTPSLSRNSSNERIGKSGKVLSDSSHEKKEAGVAGAGATGAGGSQVESEKGIKPANGGASFAKPPPPPPPPPPPDKEDTALAVHAVNGKQSATDKDEKVEPGQSEGSRSDRNENGGPPSIATATNKTEVSGGEHRQQPEVPAASPAADPEEIKASQASHLVNKHMVLPFIPPQFANADSNTLLKPSEYLRSICKASAKSSLSKARSVDNLDIQSRGLDRREEVCGNQREEEPSGEVEVTEAETGSATKKESFAGPPPPPLCPLQKARRNDEDSVGVSTSTESESSRTPQPLATISIQDLTSIQLRRTTAKMNATKTFSAPPPRSVSMTNVAESFFVQKTDLIAELKRTKDIPGIKKLKVEMAQVEKTQEQNLMSEINKAFNVSKFVDQIPEKDSSGNVIPIWKRQMLARKAAERAKKELEEQIARENEERRQKAIPAWKRQLLAKKDNEEKRLIQAQPVSTVKVETAQRPEEKPDAEEKKSETSTSPSTGTQGTHRTQETNDDAPIIPWRAQLRKTNSKLNILE